MPAIATPERTEEFLRAIGDPKQAVDELRQVQRSAQVLSTDHPRLIDLYLKRWVALHNGEVIADAATIEKLLERVDEIDPQSRSHVLVRFIDRRQRTMIL